MKVIIPLAGLDYFSESIPKGLKDYGNGPFLKWILQSRPWYSEIPHKNYTFIFLDCNESRSFFKNYVSKWFKGARSVFISHTSKGAALSALSAISASFDDNFEPIIFDLADIYFESNSISVMNIFEDDIDSYIFSFKSSLSQYSYIDIDADGFILEAKEKEVISSYATVGVYIYKAFSTYLQGLIYYLQKSTVYTYNSLYYLCPVVNGVLNSGLRAKSIEVKSVIDIKNDTFS